MSSINKRPETLGTHEGGVASHISPEQMLRRSVMACMLWEDSFYEDGVSIAERIEHIVCRVDAVTVAEIAIEARDDMNLRHVPLLLCVALARIGKLKADTLASVIQRPDELTEFMAMYWKDGRCPIAAQVKKGLAKAFTKFNHYSLAKYNRDNAIKLRDVLFLCHAKPKDADQADTWRRLISGTLSPPDTWEVALSSGGNKFEHWTRLLTEDRLGSLALLRNLRNMHEAGCQTELVREALAEMDTSRVLPFRFIAAAKYNPQWESMIEVPMLAGLREAPKFNGKTVLLVDVSGSMEYDTVSKRSDMTRLDAACGLGVCLRDMCEDIAIYTFSERTVRVPDRHGFALRDAITDSQRHWSTNLAAAIRHVNGAEQYDRMVIITDEQSHDGGASPLPDTKAYMLNVASYENGVGYGPWTHITGFSESVLKYMLEYEKL